MFTKKSWRCAEKERACPSLSQLNSMSRAHRIFHWIYQKNCLSKQQCTDDIISGKFLCEYTCKREKVRTNPKLVYTYAYNFVDLYTHVYFCSLKVRECRTLLRVHMQGLNFTSDRTQYETSRDHVGTVSYFTTGLAT